MIICIVKNRYMPYIDYINIQHAQHSAHTAQNDIKHI